MKTRVTQLDIARAAGVHNTTVSLSLRNCPAIPASTRERIRSIAVELGYYPDPALQALVAYRSGRAPNRRQETIAYVTQGETRWGWRAQPAHEQYYAGALRKAVERGYGLEHFWLGEPGLSGRRLSDMLFHRGIVGVLLASPIGAHAAAGMEWGRFSVVRIDRPTHVPPLHFVANDQTGMIRTAMRQARAAGYRRIGLVMPSAWDDAANQAWSAGFLTEQARMPANDRIPMLCYAKGASTEPAARDAGSGAVEAAAFEAWFGRHRPEVILSHTPFVRTCFERLGLTVPRDVAFADLFLDGPEDRLAGIRQPCTRVGETAVELLVAHLHRHEVGLPAVPTATLLEGTWVNGTSLPARQLANRPTAEHCVGDSAA